jgi:hypothetical protein
VFLFFIVMAAIHREAYSATNFTFFNYRDHLLPWSEHGNDGSLLFRDDHQAP